MKYTDPDGRSLAGIIRGLTVLVVTSVAVNMPTKEEHYARNEKQLSYQENCLTKQEALNKGFRQLGIEKGPEKAEKMDNYHEMGQGSPSPTGNNKLVLEDGKGSFELVYDSNDNLVTDPVNMGTYNNCDANTSYIGHFVKDMLPYYLWGNSEDDPTTMGERIFGNYKYDVNSTKSEAKDQRLQDTLSTLREAHIW